MTKWTDPIKESQAATAAAWGGNRQLARNLLMKAKFYRVTAMVFVVIGMILLIKTYITHIDGHFLATMRNPATIMAILLPFIPAVVFSILAQKAERAFAALKPYASANDKAAPAATPPAKK